VFRPVHHHAENETIAAISEPALAEAANCRGEGKAAAVGGFFYHVGCWQILLQKSFWGVERKFLEPLMRFARGDVRDHIG
jgi:hypothetical protein